jgi:hypothetical protein
MAGMCEGVRRKGGTSVVEKAECEMEAVCFCRASTRGRVEFLCSRKARFHQGTNKTAKGRSRKRVSQTILTGDSPSTHPAREVRVLKVKSGPSGAPGTRDCCLVGMLLFFQPSLHIIVTGLLSNIETFRKCRTEPYTKSFHLGKNRQNCSCSCRLQTHLKVIHLPIVTFWRPGSSI